MLPVLLIAETDGRCLLVYQVKEQSSSQSLIARHSRAVAYAVALLVTILWSSSYVLIKSGLNEVPPIYFATLRYALAFAILATIDRVSHTGRNASKANHQRRGPTLVLIAAGVAGYTVAQGFQYVGLFFLPAVTTSFLLTFNPMFVLFIGMVTLSEKPSRLQILGLAIALLGAYSFFYEKISWQGDWLGVGVVLLSGIGWAAYVVIVRGLQKTNALGSLRLTTVTMGIGVVGMVVLSAATGEYAPLPIDLILSVAWLASVNTALAFLLWNWVLKMLPAYELTVVQNLMLIEVGLLSFLFLQEVITVLMMVGMALVIGGVFLVQTRVLRTG